MLNTKLISGILLVLPLVLSDYITNDYVATLYRITDTGEVSILAKYPDTSNKYNSAVFQPPHMYYSLGPQLFSYNISSGKSQLTPFSKPQSLAVMCQSLQTGTFYSLNLSSSTHATRYNLFTFSTDGTVTFISTLALKYYGDYIQQCVVDNTHNAIYWIVGYDTQISATILMTDMNSFTTIVLHQVSIDVLAIYLANNDLYVIQSNFTSSTLYLATVPSSGDAKLTPISVLPRHDFKSIPYMVGATNFANNAAILFGNNMYEWFFSGDGIHTIQLSTFILLNPFTAAWVPSL